MRFDADFNMTIDGRAVAAPESFEILNPATEAVIAHAPDISREQLDEAVAAARRAFPGWRSTPLAERQAVLNQIAARLMAHQDPLARLLTSEQGKPTGDAMGEIAQAAYWLTEVAKQVPPVEVVSDTPQRRVEVRHTPVGVVGAIAPWNFPIALAIWKIAPALLTGNTLVLKPSPFTPLSTLKIGELVADLLPPGVLNVVTGGDRLGPWITEHPGIDKISFTGSSHTGRAVMRSASATLKRVTLELGGNDPAVIMPDADVEALAPKLFWAAFSNNAQICVASKRMYVHESIYDRFAAALVAYAKTVKIGDGSEQGVAIGPIQNRPQFQRVSALLEDARSTGVKFLLGGEVAGGQGYFIPISIADNPPDDSRIVVEEAFGPVLPLLKFSSDDEVVSRANDTPYGLAASVWGTDLAKAQAVADRLDAGTVWVNTIFELSPNYSFGGRKQSGLGVENGLDGLLEYTNPQTMVIARGELAAAG